MFKGLDNYIELVKTFATFLWKRDSESAVCVIIWISMWMTKNDLEQSRDYLRAVLENYR